MGAELGTNIVVLLGSHSNEMKVGQKLLEIGLKMPHRIAHPEAVAKGERYLGTGPDARQIWSQYPGDPQGDPEQRAAYENLK
jgi:hypothetical protein